MDETDLSEAPQSESELLARARAGDGDAFADLTEPWRRELLVHCYRILGSVHDAEEVLQEAMQAAWRGLARFDGRSSPRTWLYRVATSHGLDWLRGGDRRAMASWPEAGEDSGEMGQLPSLPEPATANEPLWLEPYPDVMLDELAGAAPGPAARYAAGESISLAFVAALQHLPPRQRATLVLRDALGFRTAEAADILDCTLDAVNGSLKRARATLAGLLPAGGLSQAPLPGSAAERELLARFTDAFEWGDDDALVAMLTDDIWLTVPPLPFGYRGREAAANLLSVVCLPGGARRFRLVAVRANGQPAFGCYIRDAQAPIAHAHGLIVLTLSGDRIAGVTRFLDNSTLPRFGLPRTLPDYRPRHARTP